MAIEPKNWAEGSKFTPCKDMRAASVVRSPDLLARFPLDPLVGTNSRVADVGDRRRDGNIDATFHAPKRGVAGLIDLVLGSSESRQLRHDREQVHRRRSRTATEWSVAPARTAAVYRRREERSDRDGATDRWM